MPILRKLKSLLGADDADEESERDVTVTVEHDPENEAALKGADLEEPEEEEEPEETADEALDADEETEDESTDADADEPVEIPDAEGGTANAESGADADGDEVETGDVDDEEAETGDADGDEAETGDADGDEVETGHADGDETDAGAGDAEASGSDESVDVLNGIGPAYAERLGNAGVETVGQLAAADAATLAEDADIAEGRIQGWIDQASEY